jgi:Type IV secretion-system coupling protein DNA-binding domain
MDNPDRVTYFAATDSRGQRTPFGLKAKDRNRHMYVIGKTGMGKSTLLENMAIQDIQNGEGMAFIDPHGSAVESLLEYVPAHRVKDVVYFAPFDMEHPISFNVMEDVGYDKRHLVTSGLMATFKKIWQDAWSARMEYILTNTLLALLEYPDATLLGVNRMYTDKVYRTKVVDNIKDPVVKDFWTKEFANYTDRFTQEATPAIQNKIGQFTSNPLIRNIIGQPKSSFDIRELMDNKKILLINLSKGLVGDVNMRLLGSMTTTRIFLAAMSRAELAPQELKQAPPFYFYVDEFQNFANETFAEILSEARKYNLNLVMAHQYVEQMEDEVKAAVFGNVGTTVSYRVGPFDAEVLETIFLPKFTKEDLVNLGQYQMYLTLMIDGVGSPPFSAVGIPPIEPPKVSLRQQVIDNSRVQFAVNRAKIEDDIFTELLPPAPALRPQEPKRPAPQEEVRPRRPDAPRPRNDAPRPERKTPRPPERPRQEARPTPPQEGKSLDDLKSILRTMTESTKVQQEVKKTEQVSELQGAIAAVQPKEEKRQGEHQPFEVPEDTLRGLFKE